MLFQRVLLPLVAAIAAMGQTTTTSTTTRTSTLPPIGLAASESAQINVVNFATATTGGTAASCTGSIAFVNAAGATLGTASNYTVTSGQTFSKTLPYATTAASGRTVVRGVVTLTTTTGSNSAPCSLAVTLETFNTATGATHAYVVSDGTFSGSRR